MENERKRYLLGIKSTKRHLIITCFKKIFQKGADGTSALLLMETGSVADQPAPVKKVERI